MKNKYMICETMADVFTKTLQGFKKKSGVKNRVIEHFIETTPDFIHYTLKSSNRYWLNKFHDHWNEVKEKEEKRNVVLLKILEKYNKFNNL